MGSGSFANLGGPGPVEGAPGRVKAPDVLRNSVRAEMPSLVPRMVGREI